MPYFSQRSRRQLEQAHPLLQDLFNEVIKHFDCIVIESYRSREDQNKAFRKGTSKLKYPHSKHNKTPALAVDVAPFPIRWPDPIKRADTFAKDLARFYMFVGFVKATAKQMNIPIRSGADWDNDNKVDDQTFDDLPHFELVGYGHAFDSAA